MSHLSFLDKSFFNILRLFDMYTIKAISQLTGLNSNTIRSWERRYDAVSPKRDENGRRFYNEGDAERLTLLASLIEEGHPIGTIIHLKNDELSSLKVKPKDLYEDAFLDDVFDKLIMAVNAGDLEGITKLTTAALTLFPLKDVFDKVISPALSHIGRLWQEGIIEISQEHLYTAHFKKLLYPLIAHDRTNVHKPKTLITTLPQELHEMGALMAACISTEHDCDTFYLGPDTPVKSILASVNDHSIDAVILSMVYEGTLGDQNKNLLELDDKLPHYTKLWVGLAQRDAFKPENYSKRVAFVHDYRTFSQKISVLQKRDD